MTNGWRHCYALLTVSGYAVYAAADDKQITVLIDVDFAAAFDTLIHDTLLERTQTEFRVTATALSLVVAPSVGLGGLPPQNVA